MLNHWSITYEPDRYFEMWIKRYGPRLTSCQTYDGGISESSEHEAHGKCHTKDKYLS